jgi:CheY-like chemotaxis protein
LSASAHPTIFLAVATTLIVVEDDDDVRELAVNVLREAGFNVLQAMNGGIALVLLTQDIQVDLVFTDVVMPGDPDGFELARRAVALRPGLRILYTTGFAGLGLAGERPLFGPILRKPWRADDLRTAVAELLKA